MKQIASAHPDRQGVVESKRHSQLAGTPLGRMVLGGKLDPEHMEAARRYAIDVRRFQVAIRAPSPNVPAIAIGVVRGAPDPLSAAEIARRREAYDAAFEALELAGHRKARCVARVAVYDEGIPDGCDFDDLKAGLSTLVDHYGLTTKGKSGYSRNRN